MDLKELQEVVIEELIRYELEPNSDLYAIVSENVINMNKISQFFNKMIDSLDWTEIEKRVAEARVEIEKSLRYKIVDDGRKVRAIVDTQHALYTSNCKEIEKYTPFVVAVWEAAKFDSRNNPPWILADWQTKQAKNLLNTLNSK